MKIHESLSSSLLIEYFLHSRRYSRCVKVVNFPFIVILNDLRQANGFGFADRNDP